MKNVSYHLDQLMAEYVLYRMLKLKEDFRNRIKNSVNASTEEASVNIKNDFYGGLSERFCKISKYSILMLLEDFLRYTTEKPTRLSETNDNERMLTQHRTVSLNSQHLFYQQDIYKGP